MLIPNDYRDLLKSKNAQLLLLSGAISRLGDWFCFPIILTLIYNSGGAGAVALATVLKQVPGLILTPFAGAIADRYSKRHLMVVADFLNAILFSLLVWLSMGVSPPASLLIVLTTLSSLVSLFFRAGRSSLAPNITTEKTYPLLTSLDGTLSSTALLIAPMMGAAVVATLSPAWALAINSLSFILSGLFVVLIDAQNVIVSTTKKERPSLLSETLEGLRYISRSFQIRSVIGSSFFIHVTVGGTWVFLSAILSKSDTTAMAFYTSLIGIGSIVGLFLGGFYRRLTPVLFLGLPFAVLGVTESNLSIAASLIIIGFLANVAEPHLWSLFRNATPSQLYGRVYMAIDSLCLLGLAAGAFLCERLIEMASPHIAFGAFSALITVGLLGVFLSEKSGTKKEDTSVSI